MYTGFNIGDSVLISENSPYYGKSINNPKDVDGVVSDITGNDDLFVHSIRVEWSNGTTNVYREGDLKLSGKESYEAALL